MTLLQQKILFFRVIAPFHFDYFFQMFVRATPTFSMEISSKLFMITLQQFDQNFTFNIFQKVVRTTPTFSMGIASKLCCYAQSRKIRKPRNLKVFESIIKLFKLMFFPKHL
jgi:hypothetical protein